MGRTATERGQFGSVRRRRVSLLHVAILFGSAVLFLSGCGGDAATEAEDDGGLTGEPLIVNQNVAIATLDPASACNNEDVGVLRGFYTTLTKVGRVSGPDGTTKSDQSKIEPYLADSWSVSDDGLIYTFSLHEDIAFPSGTPLDAEAVKYSLERVMTIGGCGAYIIQDGILEPNLIQSIEAPDPATVVITLSQPDPNLPLLVAQPSASIVDPSIVEENGGVREGEINEYLTSTVAGFGPYLLAEYEPNRRIVMEPNSAFPDSLGPVPPNRIVLNFVNSDSTLLLQARSGEADVTLGLSFQAIDSLKGNDAVRLIVNETGLLNHIDFNNELAPGNNVTFRQAMSYAVPYQEIVDGVLYGFGTRVTCPYAPSFEAYDAEVCEPREFDIDRAEALLAESGVDLPMTVEFSIQEGNAIDEQIATIVQGVWRDIGVNLEIRTLSATDYNNGLQEGQLQAYIRNGGPAIVDAGYFLGYEMQCGNAFNTARVCIPEADELLAQARAESDPEERMELYREIGRLWVEAMPKIQLYAPQSVTVLSDAVKDYNYGGQTIDVVGWSK